jgi:transcriptional regulator with XRE-family HTH domain
VAAEKVSPAHAAVGWAMKMLRARKELSQEAAARRAGLNLNMWSAIERGEQNATLRTLLLIARGLDAALSEVFATAEERPVMPRRGSV